MPLFHTNALTAVKGVLDNVEKSAGLVKKDMPYGDDDDNGDYLSQ